MTGKSELFICETCCIRVEINLVPRAIMSFSCRAQPPVITKKALRPWDQGWVEILNGGKMNIT